MDSLDSRPLSARPVFHFANHHGGVDVRPNPFESHPTRPIAGKNHVVDANHFFGHVLFLPGGTGAVLGG